MYKEENLTLKDIIECVNLHSGLNIYNTKSSRILGSLRSIYYKIAQDNLFIHDLEIGKEIGKSNNAVYESLTRIDILLRDPLYRDLYYKCVRYLDCRSEEKYQEGYVEPEIEIEQTNRLEGVLSDFNVLLELNDIDIEEFKETRLEPFMRMKRILIN